MLVATKNRIIMMSNLDTKLQDILEDWYPGTQYQEVIPKLKQAFADAQTEGLLKDWGRPEIEIVTRYERGKEPKVIMVDGKEVMTGQEWYERFKKEIAPWKRNHKITMLEVMTIAEGASYTKENT